MKKSQVRININGDWCDLLVDPGERLIDTLRDQLALTGTKEGCGEGDCGTCTINLNGKAILSCLMLTVQADEATILTIEGLQNGPELHPLQETFITESAVQCGYCTPGMIMAANALIEENPAPDLDRIKTSLANNLCRCTGYDRPLKAVVKAAEKMAEVANE